MDGKIISEEFSNLILEVKKEKEMDISHIKINKDSKFNWGYGLELKIKFSRRSNDKLF